MAALSIGTFNIRYANKHDGEDQWKNRKASVAALLAGLNLDVIGFQEVLHSQLFDLQEAMKGYACVGEGREGGVFGEFNPIFVSLDKFKVLFAHTRDELIFTTGAAKWNILALRYALDSW